MKFAVEVLLDDMDVLIKQQRETLRLMRKIIR